MVDAGGRSRAPALAELATLVPPAKIASCYFCRTPRSGIVQTPNIQPLKINARDKLGHLFLNGGRLTKVVEPEGLTVLREYEILWKRQEIDLSELAKLRRIKKWTISRIAAELGVGATKVKCHLRNLPTSTSRHLKKRAGLGYDPKKDT